MGVHVFLLSFLIIMCFSTEAFVPATSIGTILRNKKHKPMTSSTLHYVDEKMDSSIFELSDPNTSTSAVDVDYDTLLHTVTTRRTPPEEVFNAMLRMEKKSYNDVRKGDTEEAKRMTKALEGDWRPVFTNGSSITQERLGGLRVNYLPIKFVISMRPEDGRLQNGIYLGRAFHVVRITGSFDYDPQKRKFRFGFHHMSLLSGLIEVEWEQGVDDVKFATTMGLGGKVGLWNILLADENMMMARGAGQGLTLWKREAGHTAVW